MSLKRSIAPLDSQNGQLRSRKELLNAIEPNFDLEGPLDFDRISKRLRGNESGNSDKDSPSHDESKEDTLSEADNENTLTPLSLPLPASTTSLSALNKYAFCYGMIHNARAKVLDAASLHEDIFADLESDLEHYSIELNFQDHCIFVKLALTDSFAVLNEEATKILKELSRSNSCRFDAFVSLKERDLLYSNKLKAEKNLFLLIDIVIYGPGVLRDSVGEVLSNARIYLQHPCYQEAGTEYDNPHFLKLNALNSNLKHSEDSLTISSPPLESSTLSIADEDLSIDVKTQAQLRRRLVKVFENLTRYKKLERFEADIRITRKLLPHQEEALHFMSQREIGPTPKEFSLWKCSKQGGQTYYEHLITGSKVTRCPVETVGGILADYMGLGKTLTMISTIVRTVDIARLFAEEGKGGTNKITGDKAMLPSRSTLVIVPSSLLLDGWIQEIYKHCDGSLSIKTYHGRGREVDSTALAESDIVLSTYHTVAADTLEDASPLNKVTWFRVVLDEAHIVRRMTTKLFQAVSKLSAKYRWCLTGTPIQNSLEDLASLIAFIQIPSLDNLVDFRKHIVTPLLNGAHQGLENIRILLDSVCLHRTKKLLNLPGVVYQDRHIDFSTAEMLQYNETQKEMVSAVRKHDSHSRNLKGYFGIFQLQLQLRRYCNHGTYQKPSSQAADIQFEPEEAFALLKKKRDAKCTICRIHITGVSGLEDKVSGCFTACGHLICLECIPRFEKTLRNDSGSRQCSLCLLKLPENYLVGNEDGPQTFEKSSVVTSKYFRDQGMSSKVARLLKDIKESKEEGKSIIFSSWTKSLDLVERYLASQNINFARIDGTLTLPQRQRILDDFDQTSSVRVLLMTLGTGAVGLNLTIANCVYLLEPQWNPMVENQAIARIERLGQDRVVQVIRYLMRGTVEEGIRDQQKVKLDFASFLDGRRTT